MQNLVAFEDSCGIESATAYFPYEGGEDKVEMILTAGNSKEGTYSASWVVHNTLNMKWYKTRVVLVNKCGGEAVAYVDWQDPTQDHPPSQIRPGQFQSGNYSFPEGTLFVNSSAIDGKAIYATVNGSGSQAIAIYGEDTGTSTWGVGVYGKSSALEGVRGLSTAVGGIGVKGVNTYSGATTQYGIYGQVNDGYAGYFTGGVGIYVVGNVSASQKLTAQYGFKEHGCGWTGYADPQQCPVGKYVSGVTESGGNYALRCCYP